ncbi:MAG: 5-oxoprolinase subunit PxpB [Saprospiraceae bacterium]
MTFHSFGDRALLINFSQGIDNQINTQVIRFNQAVQNATIKGVKYTIPAYCSLTIGYDPQLTNYDDLVEILQQIKLPDTVETESRLIEIPVSYAPADALDMKEVSRQTGLTPEEIIDLHTSKIYRVFMLGFLPGFPYLGTVDERLKVSRKQNPRLRVPPNAVGLAGLQTGIYPSAAPGGWQIIGRAMIDVFDDKKEHPFLLRAGDRVKFIRWRTDSLVCQEKPATPLFTHRQECLPLVRRNKLSSILKAGLHTTIQDNGRSGYQSQGVPVGGAMDKKAMQIANQLVENQPNTPVIEITLLGPKIQFHTATQIAITGANLSAKINGKAIEYYRTINIQQDDILSFGFPKMGCRTYVAIRGEWEIKRWLGSASAASTNTVALTPDSYLKKGNQLIIKSLPFVQIKKTTPPNTIDYNSPFTIRVLPSIEFEQFPRRSIAHFFSQIHTISPDSNRMGYRLQTTLIDFSPPQELISSGVVPGTIQITNSGQPIILMRDAQTTGGYYRFLNVISEDLDRLAQAKPGDKIRFELI